MTGLRCDDVVERLHAQELREICYGLRVILSRRPGWKFYYVPDAQAAVVAESIESTNLSTVVALRKHLDGLTVEGLKSFGIEMRERPD